MDREETPMTGHPASSAADTFPKLLERNAGQFSERVASREKEFGIWQSWTWAQVHAEVKSIAAGLKQLGLKPEDRVAIVGANRPHFYWSIISIQMCGAVPVPIYADSAAEEMSFVFDHCGARFAIVEDQEQVDKLLQVASEIPALEHIIYLDPRGLRNYDHTAMHDLADVQELGRKHWSDVEGEIARTIAAQKGSDTCVMLYTSGTTGRPKGVVLSNDNILVTARSASEFEKLTEREETLAYLPLAWVGDFIFSMGQAYTCGFCVSCPESTDTVLEDLREIGPTYYFAPPRVFENLLTTVTIRMEDAGPTKRWLFRTFIDHAKRVGEDILDGRSVGFLDRIKYSLGEMFIYGPLKNVLGLSRVRVAYTAGEAIGPELFRFYRSIGLNLKQLYGQTEASVFITIQPDGEVYADTVGVPSPGVELRIAENGEVLYRSPGVFQEYYKNTDSTADTKTPEGWVHTGDAGFIDPKTGHLRIIDRAKDVGKLADGSMFAPKYVENKLKFFANIKEAVVFGEGRDFATAFINIDLNAVGNWAERNNIAYTSYQELAGHPQVYAQILSHVNEVNRSVAQDPMLSGCQIKRFLVLHKELDADDGELTRTMKVRRRIVDEKYADLIAALFEGKSEIYTETEVTYEDGRKGKIKANLQIADAQTFPRAQASDQQAA
ncbi:MAG: AMP-binding protein [Neomegalonema sp.]|nr:AMP-binding protein [Neomegalonema sp.]